MGDLKDMTEAFMREKVQEVLSQCTPEQQEFFHRMYPTGPTLEQLPNAYDQCKRTIQKNERRATPEAPDAKEGE
jgi:hypothetical protein